MRFGKYELIALLGRGGMGETFLAETNTAGVVKRLVVKKMRPELAQDADLIAQFAQEAQLGASLSHGNIAQVFEFGQVDSEPFLAMEYVAGASVDKLIEKAREAGYAQLPFPVSAFIVMELMKALNYAHTRVATDGSPLRLVHRDVAPDNVLVSFEGEVKLVDFGIAKTQSLARPETQPGIVKGKARYFSPEQALGLPVDARSDIFSAGVILYQLLTGEPPFAGLAHEVMRDIVQGNVIGPKVRNPAVPEALAQITSHALATAKENRFESALAMQEEIARWLFTQAPDVSGEVVRELLGEVLPRDPARQSTAFVPVPRASRVLQALKSTQTPAFEVGPTAPTAPAKAVSARSPGRYIAAAVAVFGLSGLTAAAFVLNANEKVVAMELPPAQPIPMPARLLEPEPPEPRPAVAPASLEMFVGDSVEFEGRGARTVGTRDPGVLLVSVSRDARVRLDARAAGTSTFTVTMADGTVHKTQVKVLIDSMARPSTPVNTHLLTAPEHGDKPIAVDPRTCGYLRRAPSFGSPEELKACGIPMTGVAGQRCPLNDVCKGATKDTPLCTGKEADGGELNCSGTSAHTPECLFLNLRRSPRCK